jgi:rod shape determining protein RodA
MRALRSRPDVVAVLATLALALVGVVALHAVQEARPTLSVLIWARQLRWVVLGTIAAVLASRVDLRRLAGRPALLLHGAVILATIAALFSGKDVRGSARWVQVAHEHAQPSELLALSLVLALATCFRGLPAGARTVRELAAPAVIVACTVIPVMAQPDGGTAMILALVAASLLAMERLSLGAKVTTAAVAVLGPPALWAFVLLRYQKARVLSFLAGGDVAGANYQSAHAQWLIGSGRAFGGGSFAGAEPYPLSDAHSDFILAVWAHERGFAGTLLLLGLYLVLVLAALRIAAGARDRFEALVATGVAAWLFWKVALNAGMALGLLPVVGVPLPLVSYGGSSAVASLIGVGLLVGVAGRTRRAG